HRRSATPCRFAFASSIPRGSMSTPMPRSPASASPTRSGTPPRHSRGPRRGVDRPVGLEVVPELRLDEREDRAHEGEAAQRAVHPLGERDGLPRNRAEVDERLRGRHRQLPRPFDRSHDDLPLARDVWPGRIEPTSVGECLQRHVTVGAQVTLYWWTAATTLAIASGTTAHPSRSPVKESWKERRGRD